MYNISEDITSINRTERSLGPLNSEPLHYNTDSAAAGTPATPDVPTRVTVGWGLNGWKPPPPGRRRHIQRESVERVEVISKKLRVT